jgi:hypothetical protein
MSIRQVGILNIFFGSRTLWGGPGWLIRAPCLPRDGMETAVVLPADRRAASRIGQSRQ